MTDAQVRLATIAEEALLPSEPNFERAYADALQEIIETAIPSLEGLRRSGCEKRRLEAFEGESYRLACFFGVLAGDRALCHAIAKNPNTPPAVLTLLAHHDSDEVQIAVAANRQTPPETLRALSGSLVALRAVAGNPSAPGGVLDELSKHWDVDVRRKVALNPSTPASDPQ